MREFLGDYSFDVGVQRLQKIVNENTIVVVPTEELKEKLSGALSCSVFREFEAALTFLEGNYPIPILRELFCLKVIKSKAGLVLAEQLFPYRVPGVSEARTLSKFFDELFLLGESAKNISDKLSRLIHPDQERWKILASIEDIYLSKLSEEGYSLKLSDRVRPVVLFGILEVPKLLKKAILNCNVTALIFDTADHADRFNDLGEVINSKRYHEVQPAQFVASPRQYIEASTKLLDTPSCAFLLFDEIEKKVVAQKLKDRGFVLGPNGLTNLPPLVTLIKTTLESLSSGKMDDLLSLLRITAVERFLSALIPEIPDEGLLAAVDAYQSDRLQLRYAVDNLPDGKNVRIVRQVVTILKETFIVPLKGVKSLRDGLSFVRTINERLYPEETELGTDLLKLEEQVSSESLEIDESLKLIINFISKRRVKSESPGEIRLLDGLSEAYFSDSSNLALFGPVKGRVPRSRTTSIFIDRGIQKILGLELEEDLVDRYLLDQLSSRICAVVIPRSTLSGEPTAISPIFYPSEAQAVANEVLRFYEETEEEQTERNARSEIIKPLPVKDLAPLRNKDGVLQLSVTALESYANSPFRFYIERILKACPLTDEKRELEANQFGDLAHFVLRTVSTLGKLATAEEIKLRFENELDKISKQLYGDNISAAVETQFFNLKERLSAYAKFEHQFLADGWKTIYSEKSSLPFTLKLNKEPILLTGRVDRIDYNAQQNSYRIWDYKTGDNLKGVIKKDSLNALQLPLYAYFLRAGLFGEVVEGASISVGYIGLGSDISKPSSDEMTERYLEEAVQVATEAGENLLSCRFEVGEKEKVSVRSDFSMFADIRRIDFNEGEVPVE